MLSSHHVVLWPRDAVVISAAIGGSVVVGGVLESEIVAGTETITITLTNDTWVASGAPFNAVRQDIIDGLDSDGVEATGWNAEVRDKLDVSTVVRTSATVVTITLTAAAAYAIDADETVTVTVPASALVTSASAVTGSPTFTITAEAAAVEEEGAGGAGEPGRRRQRRDDGKGKSRGGSVEWEEPEPEPEKAPEAPSEAARRAEFPRPVTDTQAELRRLLRAQAALGADTARLQELLGALEGAQREAELLQEEYDEEALLLLLLIE